MPKMSRVSATYRASRPVDIIKAPPRITSKGKGSAVTLRQLPKSWIPIFEAVESWPYPDPDENGLSDPHPAFADFPASPEDLPDIEPFSEAEPWGKMSAESLHHYRLFDYYRSLNITRTRRAVAEHFGLARMTIEMLAGEKNWDARARAWDEYRERIYTAELLMGVKEMAHSHAETARQGIEALAIAFQAVVEGLEDEDSRAELIAEINDLPVKQKLALAQKSAQVIPNLMNAERLSRGLPTEISASLNLNETRVTIQSTDDLYSVLSGLVGPLIAARSDGESDIVEGEIVEADA